MLFEVYFLIIVLGVAISLVENIIFAFYVMSAKTGKEMLRLKKSIIFA